MEKLHEGHPELSFLEMAAGVALPSKHRPEGPAPGTAGPQFPRG
jgi:hypothetical protein